MRIKVLQTVVYSLVFLAAVGAACFYEVAVSEARTVAHVKSQLAADQSSFKDAAYKNYGNARALIAVQEYQKGVKESYKGCNCGAEVDKYTEGERKQWCTMFASWVAREAGNPVYNQREKSWKFANSRDFADYLKANGTWHSREEMVAQGLKPRAGDFIVFWRGEYDDRLGHVDIVVSYDKETDRAGLIGGNLLDQVYYHKNIDYLNNYYPVLGYGRPEK